MQLPGFFLQRGRLQAECNAKRSVARDMYVAHPGLVTGGEALQLRGRGFDGWVCAEQRFDPARGGSIRTDTLRETRCGILSPNARKRIAEGVDEIIEQLARRWRHIVISHN